MNKLDLREYAVAHRNCQTLSNIVEQLENLNMVATEDTDDIDKIINKLMEIRDSEVNYWVDFERDYAE